jgi:hypothetical protein
MVEMLTMGSKQQVSALQNRLSRVCQTIGLESMLIISETQCNPTAPLQVIQRLVEAPWFERGGVLLLNVPF